MKIIVVGAGKVGYTLAESLSSEDHDVTVIDRHYDALKKVEDNLDVLAIKGNGVSVSVLLEAKIKKTDLIIAVTDSDEVNMVCCLTAKKLGAAHTAARIRDPQYAKELVMLKDEVGVDLVINPEYAAADEIARMISFSPALNIESFAKGRVKMVEIKVTPDMPIVGYKLKDAAFQKYSSILISAVIRNEEVIVPDGEFEIKADDEIYVIGKSASIYNFCKLTGKSPVKYKSIMILGGGRIAYYLTNFLTTMGMKVKIVEINRERCEELSESLPNALIINADGTDEQILRSENVDSMDGFIAVTGMDEENLLSSLLAKQSGVKKVITKISRTSYINMVKKLGIDNVICPKLITANQILKYVRGNTVESLYRIVEGQAEIVEFIAKESSGLLDKPIKNLNIPKETIITTIVRRNEVVIPRGNDAIKKGDRVIVITKKENLNWLNELILNVSGGTKHEFANGIKKFGDIINM
ncbi:Trk system potassium uptake protein TrkA [Oxobacter pfennigii]|uniref:Trk system potassium uptake protein TrkA n=1 Tax=Oxobacter pfennigii TaxID=36849 RepID=A0A0P8WD68_9CLOT|nr:Trk system potassium transporter TrkA [Oxobacter pfennigii]KPU45723.1 Trk system potassium uptake protein TrkA [Oxobacter pfennigii]